jgi:16S rRNA (guanine1516-N2)-methyltransferase
MSKAIWSTQQGIDALSSASKRGFGLTLSEGRPAELFLLDKPREKLSIDFRTSVFKNRLKTSGKNQPLTKALGIPKGIISVLDLTAGLGSDAFVLAHVGATVVAIERDLVLFCMLTEALSYAREDETLQAAAHRLDFVYGESVEYMKAHHEFESIYYDPMYPETDSSALPKKEMQILDKLVGVDGDQEAVLSAAYECAKNRVVIKRPRVAPFLMKKPTQSFESPTTRYDMYLVTRSAI